MQKGMSALPPKADMCGATSDVRFVPIADICFVQKKDRLVAVLVLLVNPCSRFNPAVLITFVEDGQHYPGNYNNRH